ncbi:MAG: hypothetical protein D6808_03720 [Candidatus Dadabacteria bacterium]|nr:MAG: hypothetical protein D6808_03720 [Candidatus Dadabacteria bacterium]
MTQHVLPQDNEIDGVIIKKLVSHGDNRGFFREIIRVTDEFFGEGGFAQWSHSRMVKDVVKAWHYHAKQTDWWYVPIGKVLTVLYDNRKESPTYGVKLEFFMGDSVLYPEAHEVCVRIPPGVLHGCRVYSDTAHLMYITSRTYDPNDEGRFPFDKGPVQHDWGENPITSEQDRRFFEPK